MGWKIAFAFLTLGGAPVYAQTTTIDATGIVVNDTEDFLETRQLALIEAQKSAVEMAVGVWIEGHLTVSKAILEKNLIEAGTEGRVRSYRILSEGPKGKFYKLQIRAQVDLDGRRFSGQDTVRNTLANLDANRLYGVLTVINGVRPTDEQLQEAIANPAAAVSAYVQKVESQAPNVDRILLLNGIAKSLGLPHSGQEIIALEKILDEKKVDP